MALKAAGREFGTLLRRHRLAAGLTQEDLARLAGLSVVGIGALERGDRQNPRLATVNLLADALALAPLDRASLSDAARAAQLRAVIADSAKDESPEPPPTNLAAPMTSFHGREEQLAQVRELIGDRRMVTLCGPGGIGKTRLAIETGLSIVHGSSAKFPDGVWLVAFAALVEPTLVTSQIAMVFGVQEQPGELLLDALLRALCDKKILLILDTCEHVVGRPPNSSIGLLRPARTYMFWRLVASRYAFRVNA